MCPEFADAQFHTWISSVTSTRSDTETALKCSQKPAREVYHESDLELTRAKQRRRFPQTAPFTLRPSPNPSIDILPCSTPPGPRPQLQPVGPVKPRLPTLMILEFLPASTSLFGSSGPVQSQLPPTARPLFSYRMCISLQASGTSIDTTTLSAVSFRQLNTKPFRCGKRYVITAMGFNVGMRRFNRKNCGSSKIFQKPCDTCTKAFAK